MKANTNLTKQRLTADILSDLRYLCTGKVDLVSARRKEDVSCLVACFLSHMRMRTSCDKNYKGLTWDTSTKSDYAGVVLHQGNSEVANVCAIVFHTHGRSRKIVYRELAQLTGDSYNYTYGIYIAFEVGTVSLSWFRDGNIEPFSVETYRTDTWESTSFLSEAVAYEHRRSCTLMITRTCNLNCAYCYEPFKCHDHAFDMTFETAKSILLKEFAFVKQSDTFDEIEIDFMGGEPLMNMPIIKKIVEWLENEPPPVPFVCFATTNGTLVKENATWLSNHTKTLQLGASYDGTTEMQRANRGTAKYDVDLALLHNLYPRQGFHMVISKETLPCLAEGVLELQRNGYKIEAALAQGVDWTSSDAKLFHMQLEKLARAYLKDKGLKPLNLLTRPLMTIADDPQNVQQAKYCGTGTHMVTYDYDAKVYGCHLFTPVVLGDKARELCDVDYTCAKANADAFCAECRLKGVCPTCAGFNYRYRGSIGARDHRWCSMILAQMKVACAFQIKRIAADKFHTGEEIAFAKYALAAYPILEQISHEALPPYVV